MRNEDILKKLVPSGYSRDQNWKDEKASATEKRSVIARMMSKGRDKQRNDVRGEYEDWKSGGSDSDYSCDGPGTKMKSIGRQRKDYYQRQDQGEDAYGGR